MITRVSDDLQPFGYTADSLLRIKFDRVAAVELGRSPVAVAEVEVAASSSTDKVS